MNQGKQDEFHDQDPDEEDSIGTEDVDEDEDFADVSPVGVHISKGNVQEHIRGDTIQFHERGPRQKVILIGKCVQQLLPLLHDRMFLPCPTNL